MSVAEWAALALSFIVVFAAFRIAFRKRAPSSVPTSVESFLRKSFFVGLIAAVGTATTVLHGGGPEVVTGAGLVAGILGILFSALGVSGEGGWPIGVLAGLFGTVGLIATVARLFGAGEDCANPNLLGTVVSIALAGGAFATGAGLAVVRGLFTWGRSGRSQGSQVGVTLIVALGVLQGMEVLLYLSNPLGISFLELGVVGWAAALAGAFGLGFTASIWPELILAVAVVSMLAASAYVLFAGGGSPCAPALARPSILVPIMSYLAMYGATRWLFVRVFKSG